MGGGAKILELQKFKYYKTMKVIFPETFSFCVIQTTHLSTREGGRAILLNWDWRNAKREAGFSPRSRCRVYIRESEKFSIRQLFHLPIASSLVIANTRF